MHTPKNKREAGIFDFTEKTYQIPQCLLKQNIENKIWNNLVFLGRIDTIKKKVLEEYHLPIFTKNKANQNSLIVSDSTQYDKLNKNGSLLIGKRAFPIYKQEQIQFLPHTPNEKSVVLLGGKDSQYPSKSKKLIEEKLKLKFPGITVHHSLKILDRSKNKKIISKTIKNSITIAIVPGEQNIVSIEDLKVPVILLKDSFINVFENNEIYINRKNKRGITLDPNFIYVRIVHPVFRLIDVLKQIHSFFDPTFLKVNKLIRLGVLMHGDHFTKMKKGVRLENISILYQKEFMKKPAESICNS